MFAVKNNFVILRFLGGFFAIALLLAFIENVIASSDFTNDVVFLPLTVSYTRIWGVKPLYWFALKGGPWQFLQTSWSWSQPNCPKVMQHNMKCVRHEVMFRPSEIALSESHILQTYKLYCLWIGEGASVNGYSCYRIHNTKPGKHKPVYFVTGLYCSLLHPNLDGQALYNLYSLLLWLINDYSLVYVKRRDETYPRVSFSNEGCTDKHRGEYRCTGLYQFLTRHCWDRLLCQPFSSKLSRDLFLLQSADHMILTWPQFWMCDNHGDDRAE